MNSYFWARGLITQSSVCTCVCKVFYSSRTVWRVVLKEAWGVKVLDNLKIRSLQQVSKLNLGFGWNYEQIILKSWLANAGSIVAGVNHAHLCHMTQKADLHASRGIMDELIFNTLSLGKAECTNKNTSKIPIRNFMVTKYFEHSFLL